MTLAVHFIVAFQGDTCPNEAPGFLTREEGEAYIDALGDTEETYYLWRGWREI